MQIPLSDNIAKQLLTLAPKLIRHPLAIMPFKLKADVLKRLLGLMLKQQGKDEELDFLSGRWVAINVEDMGLEFEVSYDSCWLVRPRSDAQVVFSAHSKELLLIAAGKEDPDTLFFQRKLSIEGDIELGLEVKNLLLSVEFDTLPTPIKYSIEKLALVICQLQLKSEPEMA
ncbi:MAG: SCP2 sterol-binding domain-containing protein [Shewanella sp.]